MNLWLSYADSYYSRSRVQTVEHAVGTSAIATAMQNFRVAARRPPSRMLAGSFGRRRCFKTFPSRQKDDAGKESDAETLSSDLSPDELATIPPPANQMLEEAFIDIIKQHGRIRQEMPEAIKRAPPFREMRPVKPKAGALNMGVEAAENPEEDPEFEEDDITSMAHGQLEQHREYRHYARLAAWEMPLLTKMAKEFVPPTQKEVLRFRYTNYMGEEHPAEKKVVVQFCPADMPDLTDIQRDKLKKLAGSRWNPETDIIKMSCEMFETQAQNKRYLGDLIDTLLQEARDPTDTFEDVPLDTRHHPIKVKPKFPVEWRMTDERRAELEASRQHAELTEQQRALEGTIVDGVQEIQAALTRPPPKNEAATEAQMVMAGKVARRAAGKGKRQKLR